MVQLPGLQVPHREPEDVGRKDDVTIGEEEHIAGGPLCAYLYCMALPQPPFRQRRDMQHFYPGFLSRDTVHDGARPVAGPVVYSDDLEVRVIHAR